MALHEVLYYDDVQHLKQHINGSPRASIQTALSNPYHYLQVTAERLYTADKTQNDIQAFKARIFFS